MGIFDDIQLGWNDRDYVIPSRKVLGAVARIEDTVTLQELIAYGEKGTAPMAKVAQAYASVLRYAGAKVSDEEVYDGMFQGKNSQELILEAVNGLLGMMLPPSAHTSAKEHNRGNSRKAAKPSSKKSTKRRSAAAG